MPFYQVNYFLSDNTQNWNESCYEERNTGCSTSTYVIRFASCKTHHGLEPSQSNLQRNLDANKVSCLKYKYRKRKQKVLPVTSFDTIWILESLLKCTLLIVICIHNSNSCVRCIGWFYICLTCESCDMSSINKSSTRVMATFKKLLAQCL